LSLELSFEIGIGSIVYTAPPAGYKVLSGYAAEIPDERKSAEKLWVHYVLKP